MTLSTRPCRYHAFDAAATTNSRDGRLPYRQRRCVAAGRRHHPRSVADRGDALSSCGPFPPTRSGLPWDRSRDPARRVTRPGRSSALRKRRPASVARRPGECPRRAGGRRAPPGRTCRGAGGGALTEPGGTVSISAVNMAEVVDVLVRIIGRGCGRCHREARLAGSRRPGCGDRRCCASVEPHGGLHARHYHRRDSPLSMADCVALATALRSRANRS